MSTKKKKYVLIGTGGRCRCFIEGIYGPHKDKSELLALCDMSQTRLDFTNQMIKNELGGKLLPTYLHTDFEKMLDKHKPDCVIVTTVDRTHHEYMITAMRKGYDVLTEKPMTVDAEKVQALLDVQKETGKSIRVAFNYRYAPCHSQIKELILDGVVGEVTSIHFEWLLNTVHGADYYRRWHRNKINSGGLLVHKSTHHFDLVNFWISSEADEVFAYGDRLFYGKENAEKRGVTKFYYRSADLTPKEIEEDHFAINMAENPRLKGLYLDAEKDSGYIRDRSVFGDDIGIEDTMGVLVKYKNKVILTYSLNSYLPWEGYNVVINGTKGRIEYHAVEKVYINSGGDSQNEGALLGRSIRICPLFEQPYNIDVVIEPGGHAGGDPRMLSDIFDEPKITRLNHLATHIDGAKSALIGIAANKSIATGLPVKPNDLVKW